MTPREGDALVVVDLQNDFVTGSLAVPHAAEVVAPINRAIAAFVDRSLPVFATRDWHPPDHCSFRPQGGPWPVHCVAGTAGADFVAALCLPADAVHVHKATERDTEAYSALAGTPLAAELRLRGVRRLFIAGLATDYCVVNTVRDAAALGLETVVLGDACRPVNLQPDDGADAEAAMRRLGARFMTTDDVERRPGMHPGALLIDLYELTMLQTYLEQGMRGTAVFEFFVRELPPQRNFLMAAGLEQVLEYLESVRFTAEERAWLAGTGRFTPAFVEALADLRFSGDVDAMPEGTIFFGDEPILRVVAPMPEAQLAESRLMNLLHYQTLVASKAARTVLVAGGRTLVDFGLRRAHGAEAGLLSSRASWLAGFSGTATAEAGRVFDIPVHGTMAHSYVQAHGDEMGAFEHFARSQPSNAVLLIDTYDTERGAHRVVDLARRLAPEGIRVRGVRIDSGDLGELARRVRAILDAGGFPDITIFASGNLDEFAVRDLVDGGAPIDGFGVGTRMNTSADRPYLDCAYKLQEYEGEPRRKRSTDKATWPGRKQVWRRLDEQGRLAGDTLGLVTDETAGHPLLVPVMRNGQRLAPEDTLAAARVRARGQLATLPDVLRSLDMPSEYTVAVSPSVRALAEVVDRRT